MALRDYQSVLAVLATVGLMFLILGLMGFVIFSMIPFYLPNNSSPKSVVQGLFKKI